MKKKKLEDHVKAMNHNSSRILEKIDGLSNDMETVKGHFIVGNNPSEDGIVVRLMKKIDKLSTNQKWLYWLVTAIFAVTVIKALGLI